LSDENQSFSDLKKRIRIRYAKQLIQEGYLKSYTIDSLAETIGYSSRTSFYSSYKEVTGNSWEGKATGENWSVLLFKYLLKSFKPSLNP